MRTYFHGLNEVYVPESTQTNDIGLREVSLDLRALLG